MICRQRYRLASDTKVSAICLSTKMLPVPDIGSREEGGEATRKVSRWLQARAEMGDRLGEWGWGGRKDRARSLTLTCFAVSHVCWIAQEKI